MFSSLTSSMVKKYLPIGYCAVSEVKVETLVLLKIQQSSDNVPPFERTTSMLCDDQTSIDHSFLF